MGLNRIVSGNPVEVKYINYGTSVGYTKSGSPIITNGIMTGNSGRVNITDTSSINLWAQDSFDVNYVFQTEDASQIPDGTIFTLYREKLDGTSSQQGGGYYAHNNKKLNLYFGYNSEGNSNGSSITLEDNTKYAIKFSKYGTTGKIYVAINDGDYSLLATFNDISGTKYGDATQLVFAKSNLAQNLNETYIKINGELWFYKPCVNYIKKEGTLVFADNRLYLAGPSNYTKVGNPTVTDGIMGNFSDSNYATATYPTTIPTKTECIINFTTGDTITGSSNQSILNFKDFLNIEINTTGQLYTYDYTAKQRVGNVNLATNTNYSCKILFENGQKTLSLSTNGVDYTTFANFSDTTYVSLSGIIYFGKHPTNSNRFFKGSIDFKKTYINIDDSLYFYGKNNATQNIAPVPAGYPIGNKTTPAIGWVDMRTQTFTAAPNGATIGRDE